MATKLITIPYGKGKISFSISNAAELSIIKPNDVTGSPNPGSLVCDELNSPECQMILSEVKPSSQIGIVISDKTRPVPHADLLPPLFDQLNQHQIKPKNVHLIIGTGTHKPMPPSEFQLVLSKEFIEEYDVVSHDCDANDLVYKGDTSRSTAVWMSKLYAGCDFKFAVGSLEPHHFMGYSGGSKSAAIGVAGRNTINHNHAMLVEPKATFGEYADNPMRQDLEEIGDLMGIDMVINSIPNDKKEIVDVIAGAPRHVMQRGIPISQKICQVPVPHAEYDLVIASAGGYPKDINLYQAQKALTHACAITHDGGVVLLVAECLEGSGSQAFEDFIRGLKTPLEVFARFEKVGFQVGPHKAFQIARQAQRVELFMLCSGISEELTRSFFIKPVNQIEQAIHYAAQKFGNSMKIAILPAATNTIPSVH